MIQSFSTIASKACLAIAFCIFALVLSVGASAHGDEYSRIDNMAKKIQKKTKLLIKETTHYRHTAKYASLVDATTHLYEAASHVHQVVHFANNLNHLQTDLADLDRYFHQLEGLFAAAEDAASRGYGQVHGNTARARSLLRSIEVSIDQMRKDVRKLQSQSISRHHEVYRAATPVVTYPAARYAQGHSNVRNPPVKPRVVQQQVVRNRVPTKPSAVKQQRPVCQPPRQANGFSFSIGGGNSKLQFRF